MEVKYSLERTKVRLDYQNRNVKKVWMARTTMFGLQNSIESHESRHRFVRRRPAACSVGKKIHELSKLPFPCHPQLKVVANESQAKVYISTIG